MYIIPEIWYYIKTFIFHDIKKQGKHLKNTSEIKKYNTIISQIPRIEIPSNNIRIIRGFEFVKFIYFLPTLNNWRSNWKKSRNIIECVSFKHNIEELRKFYKDNRDFHNCLNI